jgi:hypothetical protein
MFQPRVSILRQLKIQRSVNTSISDLHVCTVHQQYLSTIYLPTMTHTIKSQNIKTVKSLSSAPTCFGSYQNHPITTAYHTATQHANILPAHWLNYKLREYVTTAVVLAKQRLAPWGWFWYEPKHVGADDRLLTVLIFCDFNCVRHCW